MKKLLIGCLVVLVLGAIGFVVAGYFLYRAAAPMVQQARDYVGGLGKLSELDAAVANKSTFPAPQNGELTPQQVERFARVQDRVRKSLGTRMEEIEKKHESLRGDSSKQPSPSEVFSVLSDLFGLFVEARRYQVDALNAEQFSQSEYDWVRMRVYAAAGMHLTSAFDLRKIEEWAKSGQEQTGITVPDVNLPEVPERNRELVKPHLDKMDEWLPLAFFGL
jgi:hypothetical protein